MKKRILRTLSLMIAAALLMTCLPAMAEQEKGDGFLSIVIGSNTSAYERSGIVMHAYLLATGDEYGNWKALPQYSNLKLFVAKDDEDRSGTKWVDNSLAGIQFRIRGSGIKPTYEATSGNNGVVEFSNIQRGVYFVTMAKGPQYLSLKSMILSVPDNRDSLYVTGVAKGSYNPPIRVINVTVANNEHTVEIDEYETALGLGNIQMHVGVCYE